jgi:phage baseplate assembly protein V
VSAIARLLSPLRRCVDLMVGRGVVQLSDDAQGLQLMQISMLADELRDNVERFQNYGYTARPHPGAEVAFMCVAGSRDHVLVIACDDRRYRLQALEEGEVALYDDLGQKVHLTRTGIVIDAGSQPIHIHSAASVSIDTPEVSTTGNVRVGTAATGSFTTAAGQTVTVTDGIVTNII